MFKKLNDIKSSEAHSIRKYVVIVGYILIVITMVVGLWAIYRNLVDFSEKRTHSENHDELITVGNIISRLYELESSHNLFTHGDAETYFNRCKNLKPEIASRIDTLRAMSTDSLRIIKLDSIETLLNKKEINLRQIAALMDSIRKAPSIIRKTVSAIVPSKLSSEIDRYLEDDNSFVQKIAPPKSDTTVVKQKQEGFFKRVGKAIIGKQDSTLIIESRSTSENVRRELRLVIDTVVNMTRYSEYLNFEKQEKFRAALFQRQISLSNTNRIITVQIDDLLQTIEKEEMELSLKLMQDKEITLDRSHRILFGVSILAVAIALIFGVLFLADINRSQRYKRRLEESYRRINQLLHSREKLILSVSHDIKAPMSSILGYIELMESSSDEDTRKMYLSNMKNSSDHVLQLATNLLDYHKIEAGAWTRKEMNFSLSDLIDNTAKSFKPIAEKKQLQYLLHNEIPKDLLVFGDPFMMREICSNLISNAIKYTPKGKVEVFAKSEHANKGIVIKFSVKDTGLGIGKEHQEYILQEFTQIKSKNIEDNVDGSGLGLAITKGLVEQLGGKLSLQSEKGEGSEFFVAVPFEASRPIDEQDITEAPNDLNIENAKILVVDDDPIQLTMMSEILKRKKINAVTETDPEKVLCILKNQTFDLIFLDIQMPYMNGFTLAKKILNSNLPHSKSIQIIALSAKSDISKQDFKQSGFIDFLNKPFASSELFSVIGRYIKAKPTETEPSSDRPKGAAALIDVVKDDKESSLEILTAFVLDTQKNNIELQESLKTNDSNKASKLAHKMMPLFKIMGDKAVSRILEKINLKENIEENKKEKVVSKIQKRIDEADKLISKIKKA